MDYQKLYEINERLYKSSLLFNSVVDGVKLEDISGIDIVVKIHQQFYIVLEEIKETEQAVDDNDVVEAYDGYCDVLFTFGYFLELLHKFKNVSGFEATVSGRFNDIDINNLICRYDNLMGRSDKLNLDILSKCADAVIENNMSKFTTDKAEFDGWQSQYNRTERTVDGVTYYFFTDDNGKVRKRDGFVNVDLASIVLGGVS